MCYPYTEDGDLSIDNNHTERSLRGIAVGRHNWLFVGSDRGGKTMAILRSFVSTCELLKIDPFAWFEDVLGPNWRALDSKARRVVATSMGRNSGGTLSNYFHAGISQFNPSGTGVHVMLTVN